MKIYDEDTDKKVNRVIFYLTPDEALELKDSIELIMNNNEKHHHEHLPDKEDNFKREITVCIYKKHDLSSFDERSKKLILNDE